MVLKFEKRSFRRAPLKVLSSAIISVPNKSEKRKKTNKFRKACAFKIFQNWHLMVLQKHRNASKSIYNSGIFIATKGDAEFGEGRDGKAIKRRLKIFQTKALKRKSKITPCLKRVRIMLETSNLARKYTPYVVLLMSAFFCKK